MRLNPNIKNLIRLLTKRFHKVHIDNPPYFVNSFLEYTNIVEVQEAEIDYDGYTIPLEGNKYIIGYSSNNGYHRRRFTCSHEIAHTLSFEEEFERIYKKCLINFWDKNNYEETLCNKIAAKLLLPTNVFIEFANKLEPSISSLQELSKIFHVSWQVVMWRILSLDIWDINVVFWEPIDPDCPYGSYRLMNIFRSGKMEYLLGKGYVLNIEPPSGLHTSYVEGTQNEDRFKGNIVMDSIGRRYNNSVLSILRKL